MENAKNPRAMDRQDASSPRKSYESPKLESYGRVWEVATNVSGAGIDSGGKTAA